MSSFPQTTEGRAPIPMAAYRASQRGCAIQSLPFAEHSHPEELGRAWIGAALNGRDSFHDGEHG